ncbi:MAG: hypothetical protein Q4B85_05580 [Lachnospiraceae bacterium]|nr:hypothetical protein [Lachnospiraceae bacterium]
MKKMNEYMFVRAIPDVHIVNTVLIKAPNMEAAFEKYKQNPITKYSKVIYCRQMSPFDWSKDPEMDQMAMDLEPLQMEA